MSASSTHSLNAGLKGHNSRMLRQLPLIWDHLKGFVTNTEYKLIADVLRHLINEIKKMFEPPGTHVSEAEVQRVTKVQVLILAQELEHAFYQRHPTVFCGRGSRRNEAKRDKANDVHPRLGL